MGDTKKSPQTSADFSQAIDKIRDEMAGKRTPPEIQAVGEIMTALLQTHPAWAEQVLDEGKSLAGAYKAMENYARSNYKGTCYAMGPDTAQKVIFKYYGIEDEEPVNVYAAFMPEPAQPEPVQPEPAQPMADPFDLDSILGVL